MKNKFLGVISLVCLLVFAAVNAANAFIFSQDDVYSAIEKMRDLSHKDMVSMINKSELIGYRYDNFRMVTMQYQRNVAAAADSLQNIANRISLVENSSDYSNTEKDMQAQQLYQEADATISKIHTDTVNYLMSLNQMPSITYQRFLKKFQEYYNSLNLVESQIDIKRY